MAGGRKQILVRISHSCAPDPERIGRGLEMWAAFLAERVRKDSQSRSADDARHQAV